MENFFKVIPGIFIMFVLAGILYNVYYMGGVQKSAETYTNTVVSEIESSNFSPDTIEMVKKDALKHSDFTELKVEPRDVNGDGNTDLCNITLKYKVQSKFLKIELNKEIDRVARQKKEKERLGGPLEQLFNDYGEAIIYGTFGIFLIIGVSALVSSISI